MIELAKAAKATAGVKLMSAPPPAVLEHALMKDAKDPAAAKDAAKITVALSDNPPRRSSAPASTSSPTCASGAARSRRRGRSSR